jgi:hypothetical protein
MTYRDRILCQKTREQSLLAYANNNNDPVVLEILVLIDCDATDIVASQ